MDKETKQKNYENLDKTSSVFKSIVQILVICLVIIC